MKKQNWVWMPHAGHLCIGRDCEFHLNTYVGKYIVSTVGDYWPDRQVREIHARVYDPVWFAENQHLKGDYFNQAYMKKFGYGDISFDKKYETMVFRAKRSGNKCCLWTPSSWTELYMNRYNTQEEAYDGHLKACKEWSKK